MDILLRHEYIDKTSKYLVKDYIIVLTGQRRAGRSYALKLIRDLKEKDTANNIIYIDKEKREFDSIKTYQDFDEIY